MKLHNRVVIRITWNYLKHLVHSWRIVSPWSFYDILLLMFLPYIITLNHKQHLIFLKVPVLSWALVHACNPRTLEDKVEGLWVQGQRWLYSISLPQKTKHKQITTKMIHLWSLQLIIKYIWNFIKIWNSTNMTEQEKKKK
jgi:hypothetical protein